MTGCPKESFSDAQHDFWDDCDRKISDISPKIMQIKRADVMDILARVPRLRWMSKSRKEKAREGEGEGDDGKEGRWDRVSRRERATHGNAPTTFESQRPFDSQGNQGLACEACVVSGSCIWPKSKWGYAEEERVE